MQKFGLIGEKLGHSFSKGFFTDFFQKKNIQATYDNYELKSVDEIVNVFEDPELAGLNVTIPYKEQIIPFLDDLSDDARAIGAVNVIQFSTGKKIGHNTDAFGFHQSIKPFLTNKHERALILGTGGASKAIAHVFRSIGLDVLFISRNPQGKEQFSYNDMNVHMLNACKVIVNTTPVGMFPNTEERVDFPYEFLTPDHLVIDIIYNPAKTQFLQEAQKFGATILNGESMLKEQALQSWKIWNNL